jgi:large conductance mechanosensitive channel
MNQKSQQQPGRGQAQQKPRAPLEGFTEFIRQQGVIGLAVGLVLGTQIKQVVDTFIASFLNPILGLILPGSGDLSQKTFALDISDKQAVFAWGQFVYVLISFVAVAAIIYYIVKALRLDKLAKRS